MVDFVGVPLTITERVSDKVLGECASKLDEPAKNFDMRLDLKDGGGARFSFTAYSYAFSVLQSCIPSVAKNDYGYECAKTQGCSVAECGLCSCALTLAPYNGTEGSWSRKDNKLSLDLGLNYQYTFEYCAQGDTLELRPERGPIITLERTGVSGTPTPCEARTPEQCKGSYGCYFGVCEGGANCQGAASEATCTNKSGCIWNTQKCAGKLAPECKLSDYDKVPGCEFTQASASP